MCDVSPVCDCYSVNDVPIIPDIGMFASFDPVALDLACADACNQMPRSKEFMFENGDTDLFHSLHTITDWRAQISHGVKIGLGSDEYELIQI